MSPNEPPQASLGLPCSPQQGQGLALGDEGSASSVITIGSLLAVL